MEIKLSDGQALVLPSNKKAAARYLADVIAIREAFLIARSAFLGIAL